MKNIVMCIFVFCLFGCEQKSDEYYVGKENAKIVSELRNTFSGDFYDACTASHQTDETVCVSKYVESGCADLWERMPIPYYPPPFYENGEMSEESRIEIEKWEKEFEKFNGTCRRDPSSICGSSESDAQLKYVLGKRDNLRSKIQLSGVQKDSLPEELKGLIYDDWICNWWSNNWNNKTIRFGELEESDESQGFTEVNY